MYHLPNIPWKGETIPVLVPQQSRNSRSIEYDPSSFFKALPWDHYRQELVTNTSCANNYPTQYLRTQKMSNIERPGGLIMNSIVHDQFNGTESIAPVQNPYECHKKEQCSIPETNIAYNAKRRVRSSGMINNKTSYYVTNKEKLYSRNQMPIQNEKFMLRQGDVSNLPGQSNHTENIYTSTTVIPNCSNKDETPYYQVYYKPTNVKFGKSGAVDSSTRLHRIKYDTITGGGQGMNTPYGDLAPNVHAYSIGISKTSAYTLKSKIGSQHPQTCFL